MPSAIIIYSHQEAHLMKKIALIISLILITTTTARGFEIMDIEENDSSTKIDETNILQGNEENTKTISEEITNTIDSDIGTKTYETDSLQANEETEKTINEQKTDTTSTDINKKVNEINSLNNDEEKIKQWAKYSSFNNYIIIDKQDCLAKVYDKDGNEIENFEVGIGKEIGDDYNDTKGLTGKSKNTTPAGEFTLIPNIYNKSAYGDITLSLGEKANKAKNSKKVVALHKVPKFREKDRLQKFYDGKIDNNRMSHGCINFLEKDFKTLTKSVGSGLKIYILPEESDNTLILTQNNDGKFEFVQTKY